MVQVLLIVRHLLLWARAIIIYPLCSSNVYSSAAYHKPIVRLVFITSSSHHHILYTLVFFSYLYILSLRLSEQFSELFENAQLPVILAQFSPPCTLAEFVNASFHSSEEQVNVKFYLFILLWSFAAVILPVIIPIINNNLLFYNYQ